MKRALFILLLAFPAAAATTNNDDSCDISHLPAATLLLPYFEVDFQSRAEYAKTTLFTVLNVTSTPRTARVTLWTDWGYPALTFNLVLTGYDVQPINLYDVFARGVIGREGGSGACANAPIPPSLLADLKTAFTAGRVPSICNGAPVGGIHANAIGYATVDLVAGCGTASPADAAFYREILFDNVLAGEYQILSPNPATGNYAGGNPLVHIRAIPEGGNAGESRPTNLPYTFYDRFTGSLPQRTFDRRQPLPSAFSVRVIEGGTGDFHTQVRIWREGVTSACGRYDQNGNMPFARDEIRFDEHENSTFRRPCIIEICSDPLLPPASSTPSSSVPFPPLVNVSADLGGWMYLNLNNGGSPEYSSARPSQNWVVVSMIAEGRFATEEDAVPLGNGCSPAPAVDATIGPRP